MFWNNERVILILAVTAWAATMMLLFYVADLYQKLKCRLFEEKDSGEDDTWEESTTTTYYPPDPYDLREAFRVYREAHKMTQTEMGKVLGVSRSAYSEFERGKELKSDNMDRIIKFYWERID